MSLKTIKQLFAGLALLACTSAMAGQLTVNVDGAESIGEYGDAGNTVWTFDVGANSTITGVSYSFNLTAFDPSWLGEVALAFTNSKATEGVFFNPGGLDFFPGTADYSGTADLVALGLDFTVGVDGILRLEFYEDFDDMFGADGVWNFGTIVFDVVPVEPPGDVPEPASALLMAGGFAALAYGRRRKAARAAH